MIIVSTEFPSLSWTVEFKNGDKNCFSYARF